MRSTGRDWRVIKIGFAVVVAALLMVAGVAKAYSSSLQLVHVGFEVNELLLLALAFGELTLGGFLLRNFKSLTAWIVVCSVFTVFAIHSAMNLENQFSCGCIGDVEVDRSYMIILNVIVSVVSGGIAIAGWLKPSGLIQRIRWVLPFLLSAGAVSAIFLSVILRLYQMLPTDQPFATNKYLSVNEFAPETGHFTCIARLCNVSDRDVRIVGLKPQCGVQFVAKSPIDFQPGNCHAISIVSRLPAGKSSGEISLEYFADVNGRLIEGKLPFTVDLGQFGTVF